MGRKGTSEIQFKEEYLGSDGEITRSLLVSWNSVSDTVSFQEGDKILCLPKDVFRDAVKIITGNRDIDADW